MKFFLNNKKGQSLIEVIIAMAIFALIAGATMSLTLGSLGGLIQGGDETEAQGLAEEGVEAVRSVREGAWNNLVYSPAQIQISSSTWSLLNSVSELIDNKYTRIITLSDVCRDGSDNITNCPGTYIDPHIKLASTTVSWSPRYNATNTVEQFSFITNWESRDWVQTNWIGSSTQAIWSDITKYFSDNGGIDNRIAGELTLAPAADGAWVLSGGSELTDTTDSNFNAGTYSNTVATSTGVSASVVLDQTVSWALFQDTGTQIWNGIACASSTNCWAVGNTGAVASYNGTTWTTITPISTLAVNDLAIVAPNDIWAVGSSGNIWRYNGTTWSLFVDTGTQVWKDVVCTSASNCWAVGGASALARYNGTSWTVSAISPAGAINTAFALSASNIYAAGSSGKIWNYNGTSWSQVVDTGIETWNDITCTSASNCWAVGGAGALVYYNGTTWTESTIPSSAAIYTIYALSSSNIWAAGASGSIWNYNGSVWSLYTDTGTNTWQAMYFLTTDLGWVVDNVGQFYKYSNVYFPSGTFNSRIFDSGSPTTVWSYVYWTETLPIGGDITVSVRTGNTATPDGTWSTWSAELTNNLGSAISGTARYLQYRLTFTRPTNPVTTVELANITVTYNSPTTAHLNAVDMLNASFGFAVGAGGTILQYNGVAWGPVSSPVSSSLNDLDIVSANDAWAVGDAGIILHYDGASWSLHTDTGANFWNAISCLSTGYCWLAGNGGDLLFWNGSTWAIVASPVASNLNDVYISSSTSAWIGTSNASGEIIYYNGASWSIHTNLSGNEAVQSIFITSPTSGWAAGDSGQIMKWNGVSWTDFQDTGTNAWMECACVSIYDCWLIGGGGQIARYDGGLTWNASILSPTTRQLNDISLISSSDGWAVGNSGTLIHFTRGAVFLTSGSLISSAYNMGSPSAVQIIEWDEVKPANTDIKFQVRTAPDAGGTPGIWTDWFGFGGSGTYFTNNFGSIISALLNGNQWVQYQVELTSDGDDTPVLQEVRVNYK